MIFLIYFLPLLNFILVLFFGTYMGYYGVVFLSIFSVCFCVLLAGLFLIISLINNCVILISFPFTFFPFIVNLKWTFLFDSITIIMLVLVSIISSIVHLYSSQYMAYDVHFTRFFSLLSLFTFFMFF
jgi:NADH-ubiquinone oxidoreductase chain 5